MSLSQSYWNCMGCGVNTSSQGIDEFYMLNADLWDRVNPKRKGMLCIGCVEARLGRLLLPEDFTSAPINSMAAQFGSKRIRSRMRIQ